MVPHNKAYALPPQANGGAHRGDKEVFKLLRAYLRYFNVDRDVCLLMVASPSPGDGKTTIAHNLAEAAQETGTKTLLLEADLRRSNLAAHYPLSSWTRALRALDRRTTLSEAIRSVPLASRVNGTRSEVLLDVLVAGHVPPNPTELVQSHAMADVLAWAREHYDLVVIDTPPLAVVADAIALLKEVDGVVLVAQLGKNTRDAAAFLRERLVGVNAPLLGVVANGVKARKGGYGYGYGYGYYAGDDGTVSPSTEWCGQVMSASALRALPRPTEDGRRIRRPRHVYSCSWPPSRYVRSARVGSSPMAIRSTLHRRGSSRRCLSWPSRRPVRLRRCSCLLP